MEPPTWIRRFVAVRYFTLWGIFVILRVAACTSAQNVPSDATTTTDPSAATQGTTVSEAQERGSAQTLETVDDGQDGETSSDLTTVPEGSDPGPIELSGRGIDQLSFGDAVEIALEPLTARFGSPDDDSGWETFFSASEMNPDLADYYVMSDRFYRHRDDNLGD
jgi:hypothetical protein